MVGGEHWVHCHGYGKVQGTKEQSPSSLGCRVWRDINNDKELCKRLMQIIPAMYSGAQILILEAVIAKEGRQVMKEDYKMEGKNSYLFTFQY